MTIEVLCIGHAAFDMSVLVDTFPGEDTKVEADTLIECGGGPAANAAYLLSLWGARCAFAGWVGADRHGERIREEFVGVATDLSLLESRHGRETPLSMIWINRQNGSRTIVTRKGSRDPLRLDRSRVTHWAPRVLLSDGHEPEASLAALELFPEAASILDAGSWRDGTARLASKVDFLIASERFARQATGRQTLEGDAACRECVAELRERFGTKTVITQGSRGWIADIGGGFCQEPAFPARVVDSTGAGDVFHGAFAYSVLRGTSATEALRFASMAAALSVGRVGGRTSIPRLTEVEEALAHGE